MDTLFRTYIVYWDSPNSCLCHLMYKNHLYIHSVVLKGYFQILTFRAYFQQGEYGLYILSPGWWHEDEFLLHLVGGMSGKLPNDIRVQVVHFITWLVAWRRVWVVYFITWLVAWVASCQIILEYGLYISSPGFTWLVAWRRVRVVHFIT